MKILATVAARGKSKGVKNKNIRNLLGRPLISYTIEQLNRWGKFDKFIVSTDSKKIAAIARCYGVEVPFMRPAKLAGDNAAKIDVLRHALLEAEKYYNMRFDVLVDLDATAPIRQISDLDKCLKIFKEQKPKTFYRGIGLLSDRYEEF